MAKVALAREGKRSGPQTAKAARPPRLVSPWRKAMSDATRQQRVCSVGFSEWWLWAGILAGSAAMLSSTRLD